MVAKTAAEVLIVSYAWHDAISTRSNWRFGLSLKAPHASAGRRWFLVETATAITAIMAIAVSASSAVAKVPTTKTGPEARATISAMAISAPVPTAISTTVAVLNVLDGRGSVRHAMNAERRC